MPLVFTFSRVLRQHTTDYQTAPDGGLAGADAAGGLLLGAGPLRRCGGGLVAASGAVPGGRRLETEDGSVYVGLKMQSVYVGLKMQMESAAQSLLKIAPAVAHAVQTFDHA
eukprot:2934517-Pyramimonas_sp.AAC.1